MIDHAPMDGIPKSIWAVQIGLSGLKKMYEVGRGWQVGVDLGGVRESDYN